MKLKYQLLSELEQWEAEYTAQCRGRGTPGLTLEVVLAEIDRIQSALDWIERVQKRFSKIPKEEE